MRAIFISTYHEMRRRHDAGDSEFDAPLGESERVLAYLQRHGRIVRTAADIPAAVAALPGEEELLAYACVEGVAVTHASDGWWLLFRHGDPLAGADGVVTADIGGSRC